MIELDKRYVFHIPLSKCCEGELVRLDLRDVLDELITHFHQHGFDSLYMSEVKSFYKSREYEELLITLFTSCDDFPEVIFKDWFGKSNSVLGQEAFAYECNGKMYIQECSKL